MAILVKQSKNINQRVDDDDPKTTASAAIGVLLYCWQVLHMAMGDLI